MHHRHRTHGRRRRRFDDDWFVGPYYGPGRRRGYTNREEWLRALEEYQKDLEQEVADVADLIRRLKEEPAATAAV